MNLLTRVADDYQQPRSILELAGRGVSRVATELAPGTAGPEALRLSGVLQTTLEVDQVIQLFHQELQFLVPHDGMSYTHAEHHLRISIGEHASHSADYGLKVKDAKLGHLTVYRANPFSNTELNTLENLLYGVVYPLRNALLYRQALQSALRDPLTGIGNRAAMDAALGREVALAQRNSTPFSLIIFDIDKFKAVNDTYGHMAGDQVLQSVVKWVRCSMRHTDLLTRFGGEEFTLLLNNTPAEGALQVAERVRKTVATTPCVYEGRSIRVTVSVGVASLFGPDSAASLFARADEAVYHAKHEGRDCTRFVPAGGQEMPACYPAMVDSDRKAAL